MSDEVWAFHEPFILAVRAPNGREPTNHRLVRDGIFRIPRTGSPSRDLAEEFGKWSSVYRQFRRWTLAALWEQIMDALNESGVVPAALQMVDSTVVRAHHQAAGAKGGSATGFWLFKGWPHDQDPSARQRRRPAHEKRDHAGPDIGRSGLRPGHGRQPARTFRPTALRLIYPDRQKGQEKCVWIAPKRVGPADIGEKTLDTQTSCGHIFKIETSVPDLICQMAELNA